MGSKTISVDDEAYRLLKAAKLGDESFSDVVKRALGASRPHLTDLAGLLDAKEGAALARSVKERREADRKAARPRHQRLWG